MLDTLRDFWRSRPLKLTMSIVMLIMSVVFAGDFMKLRGDQTDSVREIRKSLAESLAVQLTSLASVSDVAGIKLSVLQFVTRNKSVLAAGLESHRGESLARFGDLHELNDVRRGSTLNHINVPIFNGPDQWGEVKVAFAPSDKRWQELRYFSFLFIGSFLICLLFLRKALVQLDPGRVIPGRVNSAFNMFTEGVIILDNQLQILVVNEAAEKTAGRQSTDLIGQKLDDWPWQQSDNWQAPWTTALNTGLNVSDQPLTLEVDDKSHRLFMVSCTVIGDSDESMRGVLVTLDDMTAIEQKNQELAVTLKQLRKSQQEISHKNKELETLATRDPLTGLFNRRALLENFDRDLLIAKNNSTPLSCLMIDIDHFKRINDTYGHGVGDEIICAVANTLTTAVDDTITVGRYGGEEFVVLMPQYTSAEAFELAEQIRLTITSLVSQFSVDVGHLSASFGAADLESGATEVITLLEHADQALYCAKQSGRNRVIVYDEKITTLGVEDPVEDVSSTINNEALSRVVELEAMVDERSKDIDAIKQFDSLTGIPKRTMFLQRVETEVERAKRFDSNLGILSIEIKDLTRIVSTFGHAAADRLVVDFVDRLHQALRTTDIASPITDDHTMSRITANEYGVLLTDLSESSQAMPVVTRLRRVLAEAFVVEGQKVYLGASMGAALYPQSGENSVELLDAASHARLEASRHSDKISHSFSSSSLNKVSRQYIELESDMHEALQKNQLEVYYQPKFDVAKRQVSGMEALARWHHPIKGTISPSVFIPIAESSGLIHGLTSFVFRQSLEQLRRWQKMGWHDLRLSINISAVQLRRADLVSSILDVVSEYEISTENIEVELTETSMIEFPQRARIVLSQLREAGVQVSMDDFGTGYTSLALLADLPLDSVKIDRSFIDAMGTSERSRAIVESVINMAHALKLWVVGEGIETNDQLTTLSSLGCNEIQGYLISKPLPADEIALFLEHANKSLKSA